MSQKNLARWIKAVIAGLVVLALVFYGILVPFLGKEFAKSAPELRDAYIPWLIFAWLTAVPCFAAAVFGCKVAANIEKDHSFSLENAVLLKRIALLAVIDSALVFIGDVLFFFLGMNHPSVVIALLFVVFLGVAVSVAFAALSHLVKKAADLQQQSDLTI